MFGVDRTAGDKATRDQYDKEHKASTPVKEPLTYSLYVWTAANLSWTVAFGFLAQAVVGLHWAWPLGLYFFQGPIFWVVHWLGHTKLAGETWYRHHVQEHHVRVYPPSKFMRGRYMVTPLGFWNLNTWAYLMAIPPWHLVAHYVLGALGHEGFSFGQYVFIVGYTAVFLLLQEHFHTHFHLQGSPYESYRLFREMRWVHYMHHRGDFKHNYGIIDMALDIASGTYIMNL